MKGIQLKDVVSRIEQIAPPRLAASWDNVGLLIEPQTPMNICKVILTNDLTEDVMKECIKKKTNMIVSYHPPIFRPLKKLTSDAWKVSHPECYINTRFARPCGGLFRGERGNGEIFR